MFSPNVARYAARVVDGYLRPTDYVRVESVPPRWRARVNRRRVYALPTTTRASWAGEPGLRHWLRRGCGANTPGTLVYDPEHWALTPRIEQRAFPATVAHAARLTERTGCHRLGLAAGATLMYGMERRGCTYELQSGSYMDVAWELVEVVDIQAQLLLSDSCEAEAGIADYARLVTSVASLARRRNPGISVVAQVSLRQTPPERMRTAIAAVSGAVDGVYVAYPSRNTGSDCIYCTREDLRELLGYLRG